jgi:shikimate kinase
MSLGHVVLAGLPGSGKSTVAPLLAQRLGCRCVDTDTELEARLGMPIARVFADLGEARFRTEERRAAEVALASTEPLVIAAGGGLVAQAGALEILARHATVVLLDAPDSELHARMGPYTAKRPLLDGDSAGALRRLRSIRAAAHSGAQLRVGTVGRTPEQVADLIAAALTGSVRVGTAHPYLVRVGEDVLEGIADSVPLGARRVAVIADQAVSALAEELAARLRRRELAASVFAIPGGERSKQWSVAGGLLEH